MNDENAIDAALNPHLRYILKVFGRKPETGEPSLESLPPSQRLAADAVLDAQQWMVIHWGDMRFREKKSVPKDELTKLLNQRGIKEALPTDPIYQTKFVIRLRVPSSKPISIQPRSSGEIRRVIGFRAEPINRNSKEPEDRS